MRKSIKIFCNPKLTPGLRIFSTFCIWKTFLFFTELISQGQLCVVGVSGPISKPLNILCIPNPDHPQVLPHYFLNLNSSEYSQYFFRFFIDSQNIRIFWIFSHFPGRGSEPPNVLNIGIVLRIFLFFLMNSFLILCILQWCSSDIFMAIFWSTGQD